ncbi:MAG TPA: hypothetical protein VGK59_04045 [Ohtaekwangia sp.]
MNMIARCFLFAIVLLITGAASVSCSEDIPDCPSRMCIVAGGWKLTEVYVDDEFYTGDLSQYRLTLNMPSPTTATTSSFDRVQPSGSTDEGSWSLQNDETILRLVPDDNTDLTEDWIIESMTPRKMILIINRDVGIKDGPGTIEFILEPF